MADRVGDTWKYISAIIIIVAVIYLRQIFEYGNEDETKQNLRKDEHKQDPNADEDNKYDPTAHSHFPNEEGIGMTVGMDIGNSYSRVGYIKDGKTWYSAKIPSCVSFDVDGNMVVGRMFSAPWQTFCGFKRLIGFSYERIQQRIANLQFTISPRKGQNLDVKIDGYEGQPPKRISMDLLLAALMGELKHKAEEQLGDDVTSAILVVPSNVSERHLQYTRRAAKVIRLHIEKFVSEPMAAVMSEEYKARNLDKSRRKFFSYTAVIGVGGSHYDVGIIRADDHVTLSDIGLKGGQIGGDDITFEIAERIKNNFRSSEQGLTALMESEVMRRIYKEAERIKRVLTISSNVEYVVELPRGSGGKVEPIEGSMTRDELRDMCAPMVQQIITSLKSIMTENKIKIKEVDKIILTGRGVGLPGLKGALMNYFPDNTFLMGGEWGLHGAMLLVAKASLPGKLLILTSLTESLGIRKATGTMKIIAEKGIILPHESTTSLEAHEIGVPFSEIKLYSGSKIVASKNTLLGTLQLSGISAGMDTIKVHLKITTDRCITITVTNARTEASETKGLCETQDSMEDLSVAFDTDWLLSKLENYFENEKSREECDRLRRQVYPIKNSILRGEFDAVLAEHDIHELRVLADEVTYKVEKESPSRIECRRLLGVFEKRSGEILDR